MKRYFLLTVLVNILCVAQSQTVKEKMGAAVNKLAADSQMKHAILGFYVADANSGETIFSYNGQAGLAPASTQKIVTSVAAFDLLGKDYRYKTELGYTGELEEGQLKGDLFIKGYGDPTLGSWRYQSSKAEVVFQEMADYLQRFNIKKITGNVYVDVSSFSLQPLPGGWIWDDIGNYYGAGTWGLNWRENQYDLLLKPGNKEGDSVTIAGTVPELYHFSVKNNLVTGKKGSGDNAYIYYPPYSLHGFVEGSFEGGKKISGSFTNAPQQFAFELSRLLKEKNIQVQGMVTPLYQPSANKPDVFFAHYSDPLDSIVYWFMQKSINLYGESLVKTMGWQQSGVGSTDSGVAVVKRFYNNKGIATPAELKIIDGSGLSPSNRVTAESLVKILLYAKKQDWFAAFLQSFPGFNDMTLKSGTIRGAKAFAGYHTSRNGKEYAVAIIVNNYEGTAGAIVNKMYKVLDVLK